MAEHTVGPWSVGSNDASNYGCEIISSAKVKAKRVVCRLGGPDRDANAAFIVKACNAHETLVQFAEFIRDGYERGDISHVEYRVQAFRAALDVLATIDTPALTSADRATMGGEK